MSKVLHDVRLIGQHESRLAFGDPSPVVVLLVMPIVLILFLKDPNQAVPGIATMFAYFVVGFAGFAFFREHGWNTWERLRVSSVTTSGLVVGKALPYLAMGVLQVAALIAVGWLFLGLRVEGSPVALAGVVLVLCMSAVSLGLLLTAVSGTIQQLYAIANLVAVLFGGLGGTFAPASSYPAWAAALAHLTPQYWAIEAFHEVMSGDGGLVDVLPNLGVLLAFSVGLTTLAALRFDMGETKVSFLD
jgi:ABC-2 type transport system permease protein